MTAFVSMLVSAVLNWLAKFFSGLIQTFKKDKANHAEATQEAADQFAKLKAIDENSSAEETRKAVDEASKHF